MSNDHHTPGAQSLRRALHVLRTLAVDHDSGMSVTEVIASTGLERSTTHRLLTCLVEEGFADRDGKRRYRLGLEAMRLGFASMSRAPLVASYERLLKWLCVKTEDTVFLIVRQGDYSVCLRREEGAFPVKIFSTRVGDIRPLGIGVGGMALLASALDEDIIRIKSRHGKQLESAGLPSGIIDRVISRTRHKGYCEMLDTVTQGIAGVSAVIPEPSGTPFAAITVASISQRMTTERRGELGQLLISALNEHA